MKKQIEGQINLFDYISTEDKKIPDDNKIKKTDSKEQKYEKKITISLFPECSVCWCSTCMHNAEGRAVPRDFAGIKKPCPSCDFCVSQNKADVCEIDSYENGCRLRAEEEGIMNE